jgi:galactan 5-O-arabinofuranosyltransferase
MPAQPEVTTPPQRVAASPRSGPAFLARISQLVHRSKSPSAEQQTPLTARQRAVGVLLEIATTVAVLTALLVWCSRIDHNPLVRVSQVSGLAKIDLRFLLIGSLVIAVAFAAERLGSPLIRERARRMACAGIAALASGIVAAGVLFSLNGTPYGILAGGSDFGWIASWINQYEQTGSFPSHYPPLPIYLLWFITSITGDPVSIATKPYEIVGTALYGPLAYFCWRTILKPIWALAIGVVAMIPFIEPFKVYAQLILVLFVPIMIKFLHSVRKADELSRRRAAWHGAAFGLVFALLFLTYSGWFVWALPGALLCLALIAPWRRALDRALILLGSAAVVFLPLTWVHLTGLLAPSGGVNDGYQYFDTRTEPAYIAMWRNDSFASVGPVWPPLGELGNVGLFTVLLVAGLAIALVLGWRKTPVILATLMIAGAWLLRFYLAGKMYQNGQVRLYPRTTAIILYLLLVLIGFAIYYGVRRLSRLYQRVMEATGSSREGVGLGEAVPTTLMLIPLLLLFLFTGSATADRLMPANKPGTDAYATWISHTSKLPDGTCPKFGRPIECTENR